MSNKELIFTNVARDLGSGQFFALKLIDGGAVYTMYLEELTQPPTQPALASQITATGVPIIAPSGAGDVIGIGTTGNLVKWTDGPNSVVGDALFLESGGNVIQPTGNFTLTAGNLVLTVGTISFPDNVRQTFNPGATTPGLNVGSNAGDPSTPANGDVWYNSSTESLRARINGATVSLSGGGTVPFNLTGVNAAALTVAAAGTNYQFQVDTSVASTVTGIKITGRAAGAGVDLAVLSTGADETIALKPKGIGTVGIGGSTASFPGLWNSGTFLEVVLANNSNYASLEALNVVVRNRLGIGTPAASVPNFPLEVIGDIISLSSSLDGLAGIYLNNTSAGSTAQMFVRATNNLSGHLMQVGIMGSNAAVWDPVFSADTVYLEAEVAAGGIHIVSDSPTGHIEFFTNATALQNATARAMTIFETRGVAIGSTTDPGTGSLRVGGSVTLGTAGSGLLVKEGSNATMGTGTLNGATEVTISTTKVTANSRIFLSIQAPGGTPSGTIYVSSRVGGTSFGVKSVALDTSTFAWWIVEPAA